MAKKITWTCDGCGAVAAVDETEDAAPAGWDEVNVTITSHDDTAELNRACDLCSDCITRLCRQADPTQWPRAREVTRAA